MIRTAITMPGQRWRWYAWLVPIAIVSLVSIGVFVWRIGPWSTPGFVEYRMPVETDIPAALAVAPDGAIWFTIEFSDAIGLFRNGRIDRFPKGTQNLEPLGLAVDAAGAAWYTDTPARAISRISSDGSIRSFPLSTPIVRLGRLAVAPDGAIWFADVTTGSITRLENGVFMRHDVASLGAIPYGIAVDGGGTVWATLQGPDKLARISSDGQLTTLDVPTRNSGLGDIAVDRSGAVWFIELRANKIGRFAEGRFTELVIPTLSAAPAALAAAPDGSMWFSELGAGKIGRVKDGRMVEFRLPRANARPLGLGVDTANNVWYTDLSGWLGMLPASRAKAP